MMNKLLIPQWFKKYPLNLWVKLRFFKFRAKPISYPLLSALDSRIQVLFTVSLNSVLTLARMLQDFYRKKSKQILYITSKLKKMKRSWAYV